MQLLLALRVGRGHSRCRKRYEKEFGRPCPAGFRSIRVHDLKHTWGHRLRVAGVSLEDRKLLLGHKAQHVTTHYSAPEIGALIEAAERVCRLESLASPAISVVRSRRLTVIRKSFTMSVGTLQLSAIIRVGAYSRGYRHESPGMMRFMNSSNMGTVKAVSP